jgi:hypothetical protein
MFKDINSEPPEVTPCRVLLYCPANDIHHKVITGWIMPDGVCSNDSAVRVYSNKWLPIPEVFV